MGIQNVLDQLFGSEGFSEDKLFQVASWGARLVGSLTEGMLRGINEYLIPTLVQITQVIADFLKGASPPKYGILSTIDKWFGPILRAYLGGFNAADFHALSDIGNIIKASLKTAFAVGEISQDEMNSKLIESRQLLVNIVQEFKTLGEVSSATWSQLGNIIGMDTGLLQGYLDLVNRVKATQAALAAAQEAYAAAQRKVLAVQEEIRLFELQTAQIPERYTRGRRRELEYKLMVAQEEARLKQEAVKAAQAQLKEAQEMLQAYKQMIDYLTEFAEEAAKAIKVAADEEKDLFDFGPIEGAGDAVDILKGKFKELYDTIGESFGGAKEQLQFLVDFMKGLFGREPDKVAGVEWITPGYEQGAGARESLVTIKDNLYKIRDAFDAIGQKVKDVIEWFNNAPPWLQNLLETGAIVLAINWATGGLGTALIAILAGAGLVLGPAGWIIPLTIVIVGIAAAKLKDFIEVTLPQFLQSAEIAIREAGLRGFMALIADIKQAASEAFDEHPILKILTYIISPSLAGSLEVGTGESFLQKALGGINVVDAILGGTGTSDLGNKIADLFARSKDAITTATDDNIVAPILEKFHDLEEEAVGHSIFPDMIEEIVNLFTNLPTQLTSPLMQLSNVIHTYGESAADWWHYSITRMRNDIQALITSINAAISAVRRYHAEVSRKLGTSVSTTSTSTSDDDDNDIIGGLSNIIQRVQTGLVPQINMPQVPRQQTAIAGASATPQGMGGMSIAVNQTGWSFQGTPNIAEVRRIAKEGAYEGIAKVFNRVRSE